MIVSDDLQMHAITKSYTPADAAVAAIAAGCDALLVCGDGAVADIEIQIQTLEALIHAVEEERLSVSRLKARSTRNRAAKERFVREWRPPTAPQLRRIIGSESIGRSRADIGICLSADQATEASSGRQNRDRRSRQCVLPRRVRQGRGRAASVEFRAGVRRQRVRAPPRISVGRCRDRAHAFLRAWCDPSVKGLIAVRGGYGSVHLLPYLKLKTCGGLRRRSSATAT